MKKIMDLSKGWAKSDFMKLEAIYVAGMHKVKITIQWSTSGNYKEAIASFTILIWTLTGWAQLTHSNWGEPIKKGDGSEAKLKELETNVLTSVIQFLDG